jgi:uncharacterized protein (DUF433 family)
MGWRTRITFEPEKRGGKACIRGTRMAVEDILSYLAAGETEDSILAEWPKLEREDIRAAVAYAKDQRR